MGYQQKILSKPNLRAILIGILMRNDKLKAYKLRVTGRSYNEISHLLKIPKSTLSAWFSRLELSIEATQRLKDRVSETSMRALLARNKNQTMLAQKRSSEAQNNG